MRPGADHETGAGVGVRLNLLGNGWQDVANFERFSLQMYKRVLNVCKPLRCAFCRRVFPLGTYHFH
ncbi:protein of unknown function [Kyrpidia spormannii]|uniref:Uncharacterized protein n=2 Tax=Kyrpidia spormannii TaxID=2055160 RepID=A0ACA8Z6A2_9BACL|nr:protein of unknown function [Kyrpidia spormannii]CAB3390396.1 protein of unknown function [Kyrpidia spormannii]